VDPRRGGTLFQQLRSYYLVHIAYPVLSNKESCGEIVSPGNLISIQRYFKKTVLRNGCFQICFRTDLVNVKESKMT